jgi:hypothetical protein
MGEEQAFNPQPRGPGCCEVLLPWKRNKNLSMALASDECCHSITSIMNSNPSGSITDNKLPFPGASEHGAKCRRSQS